MRRHPLFLALLALCFAPLACDDGGGTSVSEEDATATDATAGDATGNPDGTGDPDATSSDPDLPDSCISFEGCPENTVTCSPGEPDCLQGSDECGQDLFCKWICPGAAPTCCSGDVEASATCGSDAAWSCPDGFSEDACDAPAASCADFGGELCCAANGLQAYAECPSPSQATCESWDSLDTSGCDARRDPCDGFVGFRCCSDTGDGMPICHPDGYLVCPAGQKPIDPNEVCD